MKLLVKLKISTLAIVQFLRILPINLLRYVSNQWPKTHLWIFSYKQITKIRKLLFLSYVLISFNYKYFFQLCTDRYFKLATLRASQIQSKVANSSVYTLEYGYTDSNRITGLNASLGKRHSYLLKWINGLIQYFHLGVGHVDDMLYLYGIYYSLSDSDKKIKDFWLDLFTSYAATGYSYCF